MGSELSRPIEHIVTISSRRNPYFHMKLTIDVGEPIDVPPERHRGAGGDPIMHQLRDSLNGLLEPLRPEQGHTPIASAG